MTACDEHVTEEEDVYGMTVVARMQIYMRCTLLSAAVLEFLCPL